MKIRKVMKKSYLFVILAAAMMICSCSKEVVEIQGRVIATKKVAKEAGSFMLPITINETSRLVWRVRPLDNWLHLSEADQNWKQNAYNVTINYDSNQSSAQTFNFARVGHLVVETYDGFVADTVVVMQRCLTPYMELSNVEVEASMTECEVAFNSNLTDACRPSMTLSANQDWVESIEYLDCGTHMLVKFSANGGAERQAELTVAFTDSWGETTEAKCVLTQKTVVE